MISRMASEEAEKPAMPPLMARKVRVPAKGSEKVKVAAPPLEMEVSAGKEAGVSSAAMAVALSSETEPRARGLTD